MTPILCLALICVIATTLVIIGGIRLAKVREGFRDARRAPQTHWEG